jgi:hypothetical protein
MPEEEIKRIIDLAVKTSIAEYKKSGLLKDSDNVAYSDACTLLNSFYASDGKDTALAYAIQGQRFDPYYKIIAREGGAEEIVGGCFHREAVDGGGGVAAELPKRGIGVVRAQRCPVVVGLIPDGLAGIGQRLEHIAQRNEGRFA